MNVDWDGKSCILCLKTAPLTCEHIIPESIGGQLTCSFLCKDCNSFLGAKIEAALREDPSIRLSTDYIRRVKPELAIRIEEGLGFFVNCSDGPGKAYQKDGNIRLTPRKASDGTLILPADMARASIEKMMQRAEIPAADASQALARFDSAKINEPEEVYPGVHAIYRESTEIERDLSRAKLANPLIAVKIAFEFLACHLGESIYDAAPQL